MDGVAYLLHEAYKKDQIGQRLPEKTKRKILVSEGDLTRAEYFKAGQNGMHPEIMLTTAAINYSGEMMIEYKKVQYGIYRTFHESDSDEIELYLHRKGGE